MEAKLTTSQGYAKNDRDNTLLVSAAAGSGKTFVLIERIVSRLLDEKNPCNIDELLVVTFTKAAAAEIRQKLSAALSKAASEREDNLRILRQLALVGNAHIDTIDAFFLDTVKNNAAECGLYVPFKVCDAANAEMMLNTACENVLNKCYENEEKDSDFYLLVETFSGIRDDGNLTAALIKLYSSIIKLPKPYAFLRECAEEYENISNGTIDFMQSRFGVKLKKEIEFYCNYFLRYIERTYREIATMQKMQNKFTPALDCWYEIIGNLKNASTYNCILSALNNNEIESVGKQTAEDEEYSEYIKFNLSDIKNYITDLKKIFSIPLDKLRECSAEYARIIASLIRITEKIDKEYTDAKRQKNVVDFSDMPRLCYGLLVKDGEPTEIAIKTACKFKEIYIDEYQDTDKLQDEIFSLLSNVGGIPRFMVGDIKQCIYAFRDASPEAFAGYYDSFSDYEEASKGKPMRIILSDNFRCDEAVIKTVNTVFSAVMKQETCGIEYDEKATLKYSKSKDTDDKHTELILLKYPEKADDVRKAEAQTCAARIADLINSGVKPSDIAVLVRNKKQLPFVKNELSAVGIPLNSEGDTAFFASSEILLMLAVLRAIDNPADDISLAAAMCSPIFKCSMTDLASVRMKNSKRSLYSQLCESEDEKIKSFLAKLKEYSDCSFACRIDALIDKICTDSGFYRFLLNRKDGEVRYGRVLKLREYASEFSGENYRSLSDFITHMKCLSETNFNFSSSENTDGVTVSTMHHSKGLEYQYCFVLGIGNSFANEGVKTDKLYTYSNLSFAFKLKHGSGLFSIHTPFSALAARIDKTEPMHEEMRLLYVAMTRAKKQLILIASQTNKKIDSLLCRMQFDEDPVSPYLINNSESRLEWIIRSLYGQYGTLTQLLSDGGRTDMIDFTVYYEPVAAREITKAEAVQSTAKNFDINYEYPYLKHSAIHAKLSVSELSDDENTQLAFVPDVQRKQASIRPSFYRKEETSYAEIGTAMHNFMQFCDFEAAMNDAQAESDRMCKLGYITEEQRKLLDIKSLSKFFGSRIYGMIKSAEKVYREQRYNLSENASAYSDAEGAENETVLVQGVIDCFFKMPDGRIILLDFKTDRVKEPDGEKILKDRHKAQLVYYANAISKMMDKNVDEAYLYSFSLNREIRVELE